MLTDTTLKRLEALSILSKQGKRINGLFRLLENEILWKQAYINIHNNEGAVTKGVDECTIDGFSMKRVQRVIEDLKNNTYEFKPVRRAYIPKKSGKLRPLGIPNGDDKLVQEVIKIILTSIYEPIFSEHSHGFRPGRSCHTALNQVRATWTGVKWIIVMDIKGFFDNLNHEILIDLLEKRVDDKRFINIVKGMLKAGVMIDNKWQATYSGTIQGGNLSPILANIYLNELDYFMEDNIKKFNTGKKRSHNKEYLNLSTKMIWRRKKIENLKLSGKGMDDPEIQKILLEIKDIEAIRIKTPSVEAMDKEYKRMVYSRYADDFIIGVIGSKAEAIEIASKVQCFINDVLKLQIADDKFNIVHARKGVRYLGFDVKSYSGKKILKIDNKFSKSAKRTVKERMQILVPQELMRKFCARNGYGDYNKHYIKSIPGRTLASDGDIILAYNAELRGLVNYYAIANNARKSLGDIVQMGRASCAMTLAHKHKTPFNKMIQSIKQSNGEWIYTVQSDKQTYKFRFYRLKTDFQESGFDYKTIDIKPNVFKFTMTKTELIRRMEADTCEICGSHSDIQVHHIKKLKDIKKGKKAWEKLMCTRNRKTLVLCRKCHVALHNGRLDQDINPNPNPPPHLPPV